MGCVLHGHLEQQQTGASADVIGALLLGVQHSAVPPILVPSSPSHIRPAAFFELASGISVLSVLLALLVLAQSQPLTTSPAISHVERQRRIRCIEKSCPSRYRSNPPPPPPHASPGQDDPSRICRAARSTLLRNVQYLSQVAIPARRERRRGKKGLPTKPSLSLVLYMPCKDIRCHPHMNDKDPRSSHETRVRASRGERESNNYTIASLPRYSRTA